MIKSLTASFILCFLFLHTIVLHALDLPAVLQYERVVDL